MLHKLYKGIDAPIVDSGVRKIDDIMKGGIKGDELILVMGKENCGKTVLDNSNTFVGF